MDKYNKEALGRLAHNSYSNLGQIILPPEIYNYIQQYIQERPEELKRNPHEAELRLTVEGYAQFLREKDAHNKSVQPTS
jgi:hypothetical protein